MINRRHDSMRYEMIIWQMFGICSVILMSLDLIVCYPRVCFTAPSPMCNFPILIGRCLESAV